MHFQAQVLAAAAAIPLVSAQLNNLAKAAGKLYFGTATDNMELNVTEYVKILSNTSEFGQLVPSNGMKVRLSYTKPLGSEISWHTRTHPQRGRERELMNDVVVRS
jgi:endo-1,4-beta-xylanase